MTQRMGKVAKFYASMTPGLSASSAYEELRRAPLVVAAVKAGVISDVLRDRETGRKVGTILRELARLEWDDLEQDAKALRDFLEIYRAVRNDPLPKVKIVVQALRGDQIARRRGL